MPADAANDKVNRLVDTLIDGYKHYFDTFGVITRRARRRFEARDWSAMRSDTVERLDLYPLSVARTADTLLARLGKDAYRRTLWAGAKAPYLGRVLDEHDNELAATFFNSVNRKLLNTVGFDPDLAFETLGQSPRRRPPADDMIEINLSAPVTAQTVQSFIDVFAFSTPFADYARNCADCADRINSAADVVTAAGRALRIELLRTPFFRGMSAYLVGQLIGASGRLPLVLVLHNSDHGLYVDAVLTRQEEIRIMFSFSRAYFHVETTDPSALATYLTTLLPGKRLAEIYIGLGFHKHGKTELYRDLLEHQKVCGADRFDFSPGKRGMVMIAFNMSQDDLIYKLIRDRFDTPKKTTAKQVMEKYTYVFNHDRAGRLVDVQTFENLRLDECCFTPRLLKEIKSGASKAASVINGDVVLHHAYVERRVTPLDVYLQTATPDQAQSAVIDFGQAIKDLACVNVFPGDLLIKNFGVTNLGRVVFYDYDELCPLTDCRFRRIPPARHYDDEMSAEPWYMVGEHDVFPEEFKAFLGLPPALRDTLMHHHGDLFTPEFWQTAQHHINTGTWIHIRPYGRRSRLPRRHRASGTG